jgi:hypothetical protein
MREESAPSFSKNKTVQNPYSLLNRLLKAVLVEKMWGY